MNQPTVAEIAVLIPAYQPGSQLLPLLEELSVQGFAQIILINDGSATEYDSIFEQASKSKIVTLLTHPQNQGKGAAIKTGISHLLKHHAELLGIVTADADGQHLAKDIKAVAEAFLATPEQLILGERTFTKNMPLRSRFGNILTQKLFGWLYKAKIQDTQTGLRGFSLKLAQEFLNISYGRYEFEFECLIETVNLGYKIHTVPIEMVYIDNNVSSHFRPVIDSVKIYYVFFRYMVIAFGSFLIDLAIFVVLNYFIHNILLSLFVARFVSSSFNFHQNKYIVYRSHDREKIRLEIIKYILLAFLIFIGSYILLSIFHLTFHVSIIGSKILADIILFCISFIIQRYIVFC
ncbi:MAG: hypothetical protein A3E87_04515 [Gammaproteobacteria bacterium RIFCSPHIGHO2_12_FULL_35_23]|nr:MAG: hypothetical protein A3E87_04515 [Gammaproteobacteria bacterium RIFCSPHIGHO2_12_FULL_35_23]